MQQAGDISLLEFMSEESYHQVLDYADQRPENEYWQACSRFLRNHRDKSVSEITEEQIEWLTEVVDKI